MATAFSSDFTFSTVASQIGYSSDRTFTTLVAGPSQPPAAPTGLTAVLSGTAQITLAWTDVATTESGYAVERSPDGVTYAQIADLPAGSTSYADAGLAAGITYRYRVRAYNVAGPSGYSNTAQATTPAPALPGAPTGLLVVAVAAGSVGLQWADTASTETAFQVERATAGAGGPFALVGVNGPDDVTFTDATALPNTAYWYRVRATNAQGPSGYSNTVAVTTPEVAVPPTINEAPAPVVLSVLVDWDNDGDFGDAYEDVSGDVLRSAPMQSVRGRDQVQALAPPMAGSSTATLDNDARTYSPQNGSGPLYGLLLPGRRVRHTAERPGTTPTYSSVVLADAPVGYWRLGETSGTTAADASGNGRTGTYTAGPALNQPGALRGDADPAALFAGAQTGQRVAVPDHASLDLNAFTVECWIYLTAYGTATNWRVIALKEAAGPARNYGLFLLLGTQSALHFSFSSGGVFRSFNTTVQLGLRRWRHVVLTHTPGAALRVYVDGELSDQVAVTGVPDTNAAPFVFGGVDPAAFPTFDGMTGRLDEVALYPTALAPARIREHYRAGTAGLVPLFTGNLDDLPQQPAYNEKTATLPALGSLARLRGVRVSTDLYQNIRIDAALNALLDAAGWPAADRRILQGNTILLWWWLDDRDAFEAAVELLNTEGPGAYLGEDGEGNVVFEGRYHRLTDSRALLPQAVFTEDGMEPWRLDRLDYNPGLKGVINACSAEAVQRGVGPFAVLWQLGQSVTLGAGEERFFTVRLSDPIYTVSPPVAGTDYTVTTGTLALIEVLPVSRSGGSVTVHVRGGGASGCTLTGLQLRGNLLVETNRVRVEHRVDTTTSRGRYGRRNYALSVWPEVDPLVAQDFCDAVVNAYQEPRATLSVWIPADVGGYTADRALALRPSDRIALYDAQTGLAGEAFVEQVEYANHGTEFLVRLGCEEASTAASNYLVWDVGSFDEDRWSY
jgi:hypothetical protein